MKQNGQSSITAKWKCEKKIIVLIEFPLTLHILNMVVGLHNGMLCKCTKFIHHSKLNHQSLLFERGTKRKNEGNSIYVKNTKREITRGKN